MSDPITLAEEVRRATLGNDDLASKVAALEQERDELEAYLMDTLNQLDDSRLSYIDCLKSRSFELRRLEQELGETMVRANRYQARTLDLRAAMQRAIDDITDDNHGGAVAGLARALADTEGE